MKQYRVDHLFLYKAHDFFLDTLNFLRDLPVVDKCDQGCER